jgi:hypothetical protein
VIRQPRNLNKIKVTQLPRKQRTVGRKSEVSCRREWNTPHREKWTAPIHQILKAIDNHTSLYIETGDVWHEEQAQILRKYIKDLKVWIHKEEDWEL